MLWKGQKDIMDKIYQLEKKKEKQTNKQKNLLICKQIKYSKYIVVLFLLVLWE